MSPLAWRMLAVTIRGKTTILSRCTSTIRESSPVHSEVRLHLSSVKSPLVTLRRGGYGTGAETAHQVNYIAGICIVGAGACSAGVCGFGCLRPRVGQRKGRPGSRMAQTERNPFPAGPMGRDAGPMLSVSTTTSSEKVRRVPEVARLRIPPPIQPALVRLAEVSPTNFQSIVESLHTEGPLLARRELTRRLLNNVDSFDEESVRDFLDLTLSLATLRVDLDMTVDRVAEEISTSSDLNLPDDARPELRKRITVILQVPNILQLAKAADLISRDERVYHSAKVTTDVRPIFADDPSKAPVGVVIMHSLSIEFHSSGQDGSWSVALDERDLIKLRDVLERAVKKGKALHEFMGTMHLISFEPTE